MSTLAPERKIVRTTPALRPSLQGPLVRLQAAIRRYIVLESLALVVIAGFLWALLSIGFDWGLLFQLFGFDYLREGTSSIQAVLRFGMILVLVGVVGWIVVRYLVMRLVKPISTSDLALAIERKFGQRMGESLVTAVELNDWEVAQQQGYSPSMIQATTSDAEQRLGTIAVSDVLNSPRLNKRLYLAAGCIVAMIVAAVLLPEVVLTWFDRTLMLQNIPWPRATILELADFKDRTRAVPFGSELKVTVRSAKWAAADRSVSEGWRPLMMADLSKKEPVAWELEGLTSANELLNVLPVQCQSWSCDQLENYFADAGQGVHRDLGLALIRKLQDYMWEHRDDKTPLPQNLSIYLPEKLRQLPLEQQKIALAAAAGLSSADADRIVSGMTMLRPVMSDVVMSMGNITMFPLPSPMPSYSLMQKIAYERDGNCPPFAMPEAERALLPVEWQTKLAIRDLVKRLKTYAAEESAESLGQRVVLQGQAVLKELDERSARTKTASRKSFRKLIVPDKLTLEFENLVDAEERARGRAKRGTPELKRAASSNEFSYDFKKMERPLRLRASVSSVSTPWYRVDVKPLPTLKQLVRWHDEPAYLYGSTSRVKVGPLVLPLDGDESRAIAPVGSTVWLEGESHKPLKSVRVVTENTVEQPGLKFQPGDTRFTITPKANLRDDLRFKLEFEDQDGIQATRSVVLLMTPDKPPEFLKAQFEGVNRKYITAKALLPLSVAVRDDVGLLSLEYEVSLQKNDQREVYHVRLPYRSYFPLRLLETQPGGMRFENPEDMSLSRLFAQLHSNSTGDPMYLVSSVARLPGGWLGALPTVNASLRREFSQDYVDRQLFGPVLSYGDEFLDTLLLRTALNKPVGEPLLETPYRMVIRLVARDNRMREDVQPSQAQHQEGKANETFEFNVVSEQDVLIEGGRREEDLRDRFDEAIVALKKVRSGLKRIRDELDVNQAKDDDVRRGMNDAQDATKALAQVRSSLDEKVLREFRQIYREFALNRVDERILDRIDRRICNPLAIHLQPDQLFAKLEASTDALARRLESEGASIPKGLLNDPVNQADRVIQKLEEILNEMRKLIEFNEALRVLRDLINNEQKLVDEMKKLIERKLKNELDDK